MTLMELAQPTRPADASVASPPEAQPPSSRFSGRPLALRSPSRVAVRVLPLLGLSHLIERNRTTAK